jgi:hypothetical protein
VYHGWEEMMVDTSATHNNAGTSEEPIAREKALDLKLKELEIANKEYEQTHRPGFLRSSVSNPAVIGAAIAAWASLSAAGITLLSGRIAANQQAATAADESVRQAKQAEFLREADERKFEANLITDAVQAGDADQAATNLKFLVDTGLLRGELAIRVRNYVQNRQSGSPGKVTLPH